MNTLKLPNQDIFYIMESLRLLETQTRKECIYPSMDSDYNKTRKYKLRMVRRLITKIDKVIPSELSLKVEI
jgi:hypothetical protein